MVAVAQLAERWLVEPDVAGSSPVSHPTLIEHERPALSGGPFARLWEAGTVSQTQEHADLRTESALDRPWVTIVWNDPVNLMSYVAWVFRTYFGFSREEAERRMLQVHNEGRAVVASGPREAMERHVEAMHEYGLWATVSRE